MNICIYSEYVKQKKSNRENPISINEDKAKIHKANICIDLALEFMHGEGIGNIDDENILEEAKLIDFIKFLRWIQKRIPQDN